MIITGVSTLHTDMRFYRRLGLEEGIFLTQTISYHEISSLY